MDRGTQVRTATEASPRTAKFTPLSVTLAEEGPGSLSLRGT